MDNYAGGLVGLNEGTIVNSYATGATQVGSGTAGGLIGTTQDEIGMISGSYAAGKPGAPNAGGFAGEGCGCFSNDYWDTTTSQDTNAVGSGNATGTTGLTTAQLQSGLPTGFDPKVWAQDKKINHGLPYLIANPPPTTK
jgi:hypothetical protein